jgi:predicted RNA-binding protein with PIN domain
MKATLSSSAISRVGIMARMRERWIVDAMNVIGSRPDGWWNDRDEAMRAFAVALDDHAASTGRDITVVFDTDPGRLPKPQHIEIVLASQSGRNAADHEIQRLVDEAEDPTSLQIVTSDRALRECVAATGAEVVSAGKFRRELDRWAE